jgi:autoinducer 2-degrading protein
MFHVVVRIEVKPEKLESFLELVNVDAVGTRKEPGNVRFDVLRLVDQPLKFALYEVYKDEAGFKAHQQTEHYARWKREIEDHCAVPRSSDKFTTVFPVPYV